MGSACTSVWIFEAIWIWLQGSKLDGYCIFGMSTVWIGRIAKVASFLSAMTIIIDILGEDKVHKIGVWLTGLAGEKRIKLESFFNEFLDSVDGPDRPTPKGSWPLMIVSLLLGSILPIACFWLLSMTGMPWYWWIPTSFAMLSVWYFGTVLASFFLGACLLKVADSIFLVEGVLGDANLCRRLRIWAAAIFVVSFMVDLLMS